MSDYKSKVNTFTGKLQKVLKKSSVPSLSFKESVADQASLPSTGNDVNDARYSDDSHHLYVWDGASWIDQGDIIDIDWGSITGTLSNQTDLQTAFDDKIDLTESGIGSSVNFTTAQYMTVADDNDFDIGSNPVTIECFVKFDTFPTSDAMFFSHTGGGDITNFFYDVSGTRLQVSMASNFWYSSPFTPVVGRWYHIALSRDTSWYMFFVDGILVGQGSIPNQDWGAPTGDIYIGQNFDGQISNYRVSNNRRYGANFTPPTEDLTVDGTTVFLFSGESPVEDKTGTKIISSVGGSVVSGQKPFFSEALLVVDGDGTPSANSVGKQDAIDAIAHKDLKDNPHEVNADDVGLDNIDNTSDVDKPVSTAGQTALDLKADASNVLEKDNTTEFTPDADYEPATKKYVDATKQSAIEFLIDGAGSVISTGISGWLEVPFNCTITASRLTADQSGSIKVDIWKDTYANYPPVNADTITGANESEIVSGVKDEDETLTGWTTSLSAGDFLYFNVDSVSTIEKCLVSLTVTRD
ncbi:MAG: LamG domain-containing protein [Candidatus Heimdallarchaeota archaeon]